MEICIIGTDLGKTAFHLVGVTHAVKLCFAKSVHAFSWFVSHQTFVGA